MKASMFSEERIAYVLRRAEEGTAIEEVGRQADVQRRSQLPFY
jgi:hypothetical protein